ncbi:MAG TPA: hypothetical protein VIJ77_11735 [Candidatus Tumulicola sp.]
MGATKKESPFDRWVDLASVILISAATVLTAWSGYEAARWSALQTRQYNEASSQRIASAVATGRANALVVIDVATFLEYVNAQAAGRDRERNFIYQRFRPEMRRAVDAWLATKPLTNPAAPSTPFAMARYRLHENEEAARLSALATATFQTAAARGEIGDAFVRLTVIFAAVSFLAGISTKLRSPYHLCIIVTGFGALAYGLILMFQLPIR